ncbi:hypothetical protein CVT24_010442 [Panaeolus cyanescens]|uniref:Uncharacterized protein n=1 Tax=Panaeolus cyanescens TaxID=181874 RepID=A0A409WTW8_9AGAR|nr:hypothetical protein CVT24_010442 [Panaeolus cyanescens]
MLGFGPALYKMGHCYEFAEPGWGFDPVMSVVCYEAASRAGEGDADVALSKWFLCGSGGGAMGASDTGGGFDKDESLALVFAEKAARKGLASGEFAMGYYLEVGVGTARDLEGAKGWYKKAAAQGNTDAQTRLAALSSTSTTGAQPLSRQEHDTITEAKLTRRRTQAAMRSETQPLSPPWEGTTFPSMGQLEKMGGANSNPNVGVGGGGGGGVGGAGGGGGAGASVITGIAGIGGVMGKRRNDGRLVVDVIRKNSMAVGGPGASAGAAGAGVGVGSGPGPGNAAGGFGGRLPIRDQSPVRYGSPQQQQQQQQQQGGGGGRRYDWTDAGSNSLVQPPPPRRSESPGRIGAGNITGGGGGSGSRTPVRMGSPAGQQQPPSNMGKLARMRMNLDDPRQGGRPSIPQQGAGTGATAGAAGGAAGGGAGGGGGGGIGATPTPHSAHPSSTGGGGGGGKKPQTFAEMGFQGAKADEKECVIM